MKTNITITKNCFLVIAVALSIILVNPRTIQARVGVGVGIGKVQVDDKLSPGMIYKIPSLPVINTGDEVYEYEVGLTYHENQTELRPAESWLETSPRRFELKPGEVQTVEMHLNLPMRVRPGEYFAYLEARPVKSDDVGGSSKINIAAASKLYFSVVPANVFSGIYYKVTGLIKLYSPWPQAVFGGMVLLTVVGLIKKYLKIQIKINKD